MSGRAASIVFIVLGALVSGLTAAVQAGLVTGVHAAWPAHLVAGVLVVVGLVNLRRSAEIEAAADERGPMLESGRDPDEATFPARRGRDAYPAQEPWTVRDGGGGEPNGRD